MRYRHCPARTPGPDAKPVLTKRYGHGRGSTRTPGPDPEPAPGGEVQALPGPDTGPRSGTDPREGVRLRALPGADTALPRQDRALVDAYVGEGRPCEAPYP
ncbi:hypothetical protein GCM10010329_67900 [Streptomyces spiroverticillatus]|nr:hypothetical protein GCM10010329_67900 [Streptomyces spiroverticillatus]